MSHVRPDVRLCSPGRESRHEGRVLFRKQSLSLSLSSRFRQLISPSEIRTWRGSAQRRLTRRALYHYDVQVRCTLLQTHFSDTRCCCPPRYIKRSAVLCFAIILEDARKERTFPHNHLVSLSLWFPSSHLGFTIRSFVLLLFLSFSHHTHTYIQLLRFLCIFRPFSSPPFAPLRCLIQAAVCLAFAVLDWKVRTIPWTTLREYSESLLWRYSGCIRKLMCVISRWSGSFCNEIVD